MVALTLLVGGSVIALVGQHTAAQAGPAIVLSLLLAALGAGLVLCCLQDLVLRLPAGEGLHGLLAASWGPRVAGVLGMALLLELVATTAGVAQSMALHLHAVLAAEGLQPCDWLPEQVTAAVGLLMLGALALLPPRRVVLVACALLTVKIGAGVLLLALAARHVHYAHWIPWLPPATAPYRFGLGGCWRLRCRCWGYCQRRLGTGLSCVAPPGRDVATGSAGAGLVAGDAAADRAGSTAGRAGRVFRAGQSPATVGGAADASAIGVDAAVVAAGGATGLAALQLVLLMLALRLATSLWPGRVMQWDAPAV